MTEKGHTSPVAKVSYESQYPDWAEFGLSSEGSMYVSQGNGRISTDGECLRSDGFAKCCALLIKNSESLDSALFHIDDISLTYRQAPLAGQLVKNYVARLDLDPEEKERLSELVMAAGRYWHSDRRHDSYSTDERAYLKDKMTELNLDGVVKACFVRGDVSRDIKDRVIDELLSYFGIETVEEILVNTGEFHWGKVKNLVKEEGYLAAAEIAKIKTCDYLDVKYLPLIKGPFALAGIKNPIEQHKLVYDDFAQNLEPVYFWILDYVYEGTFGKGTKLVDNFVSSVGSGHFSEMGQKASQMQKQGMDMLVAINTVIRSILNLIYDLKEFKLRLALYHYLESDDEGKRRAARLSLKQVWMDNVDVKRGTGSINGLAQQLDFVTIRDAFLAVEKLKNVDDVDLNERVKRILKQRITEFDLWVKESGSELTKRYEIERAYLKSQISSAKMYARWAKPYLKAARKLEQNLEPTADIVNAFNTAMFQLVLLAEGKYSPAEDVDKRNLPEFFKKRKLRNCTPITIIEFGFRSVPERGDQRGGYSFRGKVEVIFTSFALNEDELKILKEQVGKDDFGDIFNLITGSTDITFDELTNDLDDLLGSDWDKKEEKKQYVADSNPISALFSFMKSDEKEEKTDLSSGIPEDNEFERVIRNQAVLVSREKCRKVYDSYKKYHGMMAFPDSISVSPGEMEWDG